MRAAHGGLRQAPGRAAGSPAEARIHGEGTREMRVLLTYRSRGDVEPLVTLAVRSRALAAAAEGCDALAAIGVMQAGVRR
jgi:hypothetical protein